VKNFFVIILVVALAILLVGVVWGVFQTQQYIHPPYRQAFVNGQILTMDADDTRAEAVVIERDRILFVGSTDGAQAYIDSRTTVTNLDGQTMMPGIIDAHGHFPGSGVVHFGVDLNSPPIGNVRTLDQAFELLRQKADQLPQDNWILAIGFDDTMIADQRYPTRAELDAISGEHPIFVMHISGHGGVANSAALALAGMDESTPDPVGGMIGRDPLTGSLNGLVYESAAETIRAMATDFTILQGYQLLQIAAQEYVSVGVTTAQNGYLTESYKNVLVPLAQANLLPLRMVVWPDEVVADAILSGEYDAKDTPRLFWGAFKLLLDGSIQAYTGYLVDPYFVSDDPEYRGYLAMDQQKFRDAVMRYQAAGHQIAVHTNGDAAIDLFIEAFADAQAAYPSTDPRPIFIHAQTMRPDQLDRAFELGMTPSFYSAHTYFWGDRHRDLFLGPERASRISPAQTALQKGVRISIHLDTPVLPMDPWMLAWTAVNRETSSGQLLGPEERISPLQALRAMTIDAAWQSFLENDLGSIEPGKYADLIILSSDPLSDGYLLKDIQVLQTIVGGVTVFER